MNSQLFIIFQSILLVAALSVDALVASFAYGTDKIKIPLCSVAVISAVCSTILAVSLLIGSLVRPFLPAGLTGYLCFLILFALGIARLCDSTLKARIRKWENAHRKFTFSTFHMSFILHVYARPQDADSDQSKILSPVEALSLAAALSIDGLAVGFGTALMSVNILQLVVFSLMINAGAVLAGCKIGNKLAEKSDLNLSWVSGVLLMVLAVLKLL